MQQYQPHTKARSIALLSAIMSLPSFTRERTLLEQILGFERLIEQYNRASSTELADNVQLSVLVKCLPNHVRQHVQLQMSESSTYSQIREQVVGYETVTKSWSNSRIHSELGITGNFSDNRNEPSPMEVDMVKQKGKGGKGDYKGKGGGKHGYNKGKGKESKGKGFGRPNDSKGKGGKGNWNQQGSGKGKGAGKQGKMISDNTCLLCGKQGHWKRDCWQNTRNVRAVPEDSQQQNQQQRTDGMSSAASVQSTAPSGATTYRTSTSSFQQPQQQNSVRRLTTHDDRRCNFDMSQTDVHGFDLTIFSMESESDFEGQICMINSAATSRCVWHDMTCSDGDSCWDVCDDFPISTISDAGQDLHVRGVWDDGYLEFVLDSGSDVSVLPFDYCTAGEAVDPGNSTYRDAQGNMLHTMGRRKVQFSLYGTELVDTFVLANVTSPLISLGKFIKANWSLTHGGSGLELFRDGISIPVEFRRNSLVATGRILCVSQDDLNIEQQVRAVTLHPPLLQLPPRWTQLGPKCYGILSFDGTRVDTTLVPSDRMLWKRTTLVRRNGEWNIDEYCEDVANMIDRSEPFEDAGSVEQVITLAHETHASPNELCFDDGFESSAVAPVAPDDQQHDEAPAAQDEAEPLVEERVAIPPRDVVEWGEEVKEDEIQVDGVTLSVQSSLAVLRAGCRSLGLASGGNKQQCFRRMREFLRTNELISQHQIEHRVSEDLKRDAAVPPIPKEPSEQRKREHMLTHLPFEDWCEFCIQHRSRQDAHRTTSHEGTLPSVVSLDFGFVQRSDDEPKLAFLCVHDRHTKLQHSIVTPSKGNQWRAYMSTELARFVVWTGHRDIIFRADNEPSVVAIISEARRVCRRVGINAGYDEIPVGDHQSNGAVEQSIQAIRQEANLLVQQLEQLGGAKRNTVVFGAQHPIYGWALSHAAWLRNRFAVQHGMTPYERCTGSQYQGRLAAFGETVLAYLKPKVKGLATWTRGVFLGKTLKSDLFIIGTGGGLFLTRSIRRLPGPLFSLEEAGKVEKCVWDFGFANLGGKLVMSKEGRKPLMSSMMGLRPIAEGAREQDGDDGHGGQDAADEAALDPESEPASDADVLESLSSRRSSGSGGERATPQAGSLNDEDMLDKLRSPAPLKSETLVGMSQGSLDGPGSLDESGEVATGLAENPKPSKSARMSTPPFFAGSVSSRPSSGMGVGSIGIGDGHSVRMVVGDMEVEHVEEDPNWCFSEAELDELENYEYNVLDDFGHDDEHGREKSEDAGVDLPDELCFPFVADVEPILLYDQMIAIDELADKHEIARLEKKGVLLAEIECNTDAPKQMSTKFVRTWRAKQRLSGEKVWYRRSRFVAREFAWLNPDRAGLFSPASSAIMTRFLPIHWLKHKDTSDHVLGVLDVADAFLTVKQRTPTKVKCVTASGGSCWYSLGKVLPGQRDASLLWHDEFTSFLHEKFGAVACRAYPSLLKIDLGKRGVCLIMLHVDDMMYDGNRSFVFDELLPTIASAYEITWDVLQHVGDSIEFLKRVHTWVSDDALVIQPRRVHFDKLFEITQVQKLGTKNTPCFPGLHDPDQTDQLSAQMASAFRSAVGILLYLACDLHCSQHAIKGLSQYMSCPTVKSWKGLRHLAQYLKTVVNHGICLQKHEDGQGLLQPIGNADPWIVEIFTDSDWAGNATTRKSSSSVVIAVCGCVLFTASRTQRTIALSSAEAEYQACVGGACDGLLVSECVKFTMGREVPIRIYMDSASGRAIASRSGVGRIRHLACRLLWIQSHVRDGSIQIAPIGTRRNVADVGTKKLSRDRIAYLCNLLGMYDMSSGSLVGQDVADRIEKEELHVGLVRQIKHGAGDRTHALSKAASRAVRGVLMQLLTQVAAGTDVNKFAAEFDEQTNATFDALSPDDSCGLKQTCECSSSMWSWIAIFSFLICGVCMCGFLYWKIQQLRDELYGVATGLREEIRETEDNVMLAHSRTSAVDTSATQIRTLLGELGREVSSHTQQLDRLERYVIADFYEEPAPDIPSRQAPLGRLIPGDAFTGIRFRLSNDATVEFVRADGEEE